MKVAPNYRITNIRVNPAGENIEALEINDEAIDLSCTKLENNKAATVDVSAYTEPVEIVPSSGKTGMKKVTVTLDNISTTSLYAWQNSGQEFITGYTKIATPTAEDDFYLATASGLEKLTVKEISGESVIEVTIDEIDVSFVRFVDGDIEL